MKYLKRKNEGPDPHKILREEYDSMLKEFLSPVDWAKDINRVMIKRLEDPEKDLDGDGQSDDEQNEEAGIKTNKGAAGQIIGGTFYTKSQIDLMIKKREEAYFDLYDLWQRVNTGLIGSLNQHRCPEKIAKIMSFDINAY